MSSRITVATNRRARHDYFIDDKVEAGLVLSGTEVKSLREGRANIADSYASDKDGEMWLHNLYIPEYEAANRFNHAPRRSRKLLLKKREIAKLIGATQKKGATLVPLNIYFNETGRAKLELGVATGKKQVDKRQTIKERDWNRDKARLLKNSV